MNIKLKRTTSDDKDFRSLVNLLDNYLAVIDGEEHDFYNQFNKPEMLNEVVVAYDGEQPVACGALKSFSNEAIELKRMYVLQEYRGKGMAQQVLSALEDWAAELGFTKCVLETGKRMPDAIRFYTKTGYQSIPNYGQYEGMENSVCFEKLLTQT